MMKAAVPIIPYILVIAGVLLFYWVLSKTGRIFSGQITSRHHARHSALRTHSLPQRRAQSPVNSTMMDWKRVCGIPPTKTAAEIGALLLLFGLSVSIGGVIERSGVMSAFPNPSHPHGRRWFCLCAF